MRLDRRSIGLFAVATVFIGAISIRPAFAKVFYGKVTEVRSGTSVVFNYGKGTHNVQLVGIEVPTEGTTAREATLFVTTMARGKEARIFFDHRTPEGVMVGRLFVGTPEKDVGLELVRAGLARPAAGTHYRFGELTAAEDEAKKARRGIWK